jgi:hypothetical protein
VTHGVMEEVSGQALLGAKGFRQYQGQFGIHGTQSFLDLLSLARSLHSLESQSR